MSLLSSRPARLLISAAAALLIGLILIVVHNPYTLALVSLGVTGTFLAIAYPGALLPAFFFAWPSLQPLLMGIPAISIGSLDISAGQALGAALLVVFLGLFLRGNSLAVLSRIENVLFMGLVGYAFLVTALSNDPIAPLPSCIRLVTGMLIFFVAQDNTLNWNTKRRILQYSFAGFGLSAALTFVHFVWSVQLGYSLPFLNPGLYVETHGVLRSAGALGLGADSTGISFFIAIMYGCGLWHLSARRWHIIAIMALLAGGLAVTFTRSSILALLAAIALVPLFQRRQNRKLATLSILTLVLVFGVLLLWVIHGSEALGTRLNDIPIIGSVHMTAAEAGTGRMALWSSRGSFFLGSEPTEQIFGHGTQSGIFEGRKLNYFTAFSMAHNDYLFLLLWLGLVGLIAYALFVAGLARRMIGEIRRADATARSLNIIALCYGASFLIIIANLVVTITLAGYRHYFLLFCGIALSMSTSGSQQTSPSIIIPDTRDPSPRTTH